MQISDYEKLTPDLILNATEEACGMKLTGFTSPLPSYINRVYELKATDGTPLVAKFYRPGRWSKEAILDEHDFILSCHNAEIPVVPPMLLKNGSTLGQADGILFAIFPKKSGREMEINSDTDYIRTGTLIARIHVAAAGKEATHRIRLHPENSLKNDIATLLDGDLVPDQFVAEFQDICSKITDVSTQLFENTEMMRVHGDCHLKNLIHRPGEGMMIIDFDDMMTAPPIQDLWLLLPGHLNDTRKEMGLLIEGYEQFREFDDRSLKLVEPLRAMRIIYYLAWCARQSGDYQFKRLYPDWGSARFWTQEISDLKRQYQIICEHNPAGQVKPQNFNSVAYQGYSNFNR